MKLKILVLSFFVCCAIQGMAQTETFVVAPANNATGINVGVLVRAMMINSVTTYTLELNTEQNFSGTPMIFTSPTPIITVRGLSYGTSYYARIMTNRSPEWGRTTTFSTGLPENFASVVSPINGAIDQRTTLPVTLRTVAGASNYTIELNPDPEFSPTAAIVQSGSGTNYTFSGLQNGTTYHMRVLTDLTENYGPITSFTTATLQRLTFITSANVFTNASWIPTLIVNSIGATSYTVELSPMIDFSAGIVSSSSTTTSVTFSTPLSYNTKYFGRVTSNLTPGLYGPTREINVGSPVSFSTMRSPMNNAMNVKFVTNIVSNMVPGASVYTIEANTSANFDPISAIVKVGSPTQFFSLSPGTKYFIRISTELNDGVWGATSSFTTGTPISLSFLMSPRNNATGVAPNATLVANAITGLTNYEIEVNTAPDFTGTAIVRTGPLPTKVFSGLAQGTTYFARVRTSLTQGLWGATSTFTTASPGGRVETDEVVDFDNSELAVPTDQIALNVFPIPTRDFFTVHVQTDEQQDYSLKMVDMTGREMHNSIQRTNSKVAVGHELLSGMYVLIVRTGNQTKIAKVMKID